MDKYLYLILNLGSIIIPLTYSIFEKKFHFIQHLKYALFSIVSVMIPFIIWDVIFTHFGVWGFNQKYLLSYTVWQLPIEEWLFFICIPYACLFTHEAIRFYSSKWVLRKSTAKKISLLSILVALVILTIHFGKAYTSLNLLLFILLMTISYFKFNQDLANYLPSFLVILVPFLIVNGILTGSFISEPVVWYNNDQNIGIRIGTIPIEDVFYAFNLLFSIQLIFNYLKSRKKKNL